MTDIVIRLREAIIADAFEAGRIQSGVLAERLMKERLDAADEIERLRELLNLTAANNRTKARELRRAKHTLKEG